METALSVLLKKTVNPVEEVKNLWLCLYFYPTQELAVISLTRHLFHIQ